jgi:hypothetical protein
MAPCESTRRDTLAPRSCREWALGLPEDTLNPGGVDCQNGRSVQPSNAYALKPQNGVNLPASLGCHRALYLRFDDGFTRANSRAQLDDLDSGYGRGGQSEGRRHAERFQRRSQDGEE